MYVSGGHDFEVERQRKKGRLKSTWKEQVEEESVWVEGVMHFADQSGVMGLI